MPWLLWTSGVILALAWGSRIVQAAIGVPTIANIARPQWDRHSNPAPRVTIIVPARNEAEHIKASLSSLLALDYENFEVITVNDRSSDSTGVAIDQAGATPEGRRHLRAIHVASLPPGWLGKTHAMWTAGEQSTGDWMLFTDADVVFRADSLRRAIAYAEAESADHVVLFPQLEMRTPGERMMIAFFQMLFAFGHRPWKVADPKAKDHIGVGAFNLVRRTAYQSVGTYRALRMEVVDDMKLGKVIKNAGYAQRNVFGEDLISIRWAKGAFGVVDNLTKNSFAILSFQWWRVAASVVALLFLNVGPFLGIWSARGAQRVPFVVALAAMFLLYVGMSLRSRIPPYYFFLHPVATLLFIYTLIRSTDLTLWHGGVEWRGTRYPLAELRKGLV
jgi:cellulose synthase/poly-beta-1,6-N-acetylglucosamine synthase-like glycosyltransferase